MRRIPGKILLLTLLLPLALLAGGVRATVDKKEVARGDTVTFTIEAEGKEVKFPVVKEIDGFPVLGTARSSHITIVNGDVKRTVVKKFTFAPMKSVTIPSYDVEVDGHIYQTRPIEVKVVDRPSAPAATGGASLTLHLAKSRARVGEPIEMEVTLRYPAGRNIVQTELEKPQFENVWIKQVGQPVREVRGDEVVERYRYLIFPQKAGRFKLGPLTAKVARRVRVKPPISDPFFDQDDFFNDFFARLEWKRIASNSAELQVDPLPGGVELYGDFTIHADVDKREVKAGKPVELTVTVEGEGNVEDIPKFDFDIPGAVVYSDDPVVKEWVHGGKYGGRFVQKITIVADQDFTIPSLSLRYYDPSQQKVVEKRTPPIEVKVTGTPPGAAASSKPAQTQEMGSLPAPSPESGKLAEKASSGGKAIEPWLTAALLLLGVLLGAGGVRMWESVAPRLRGRGKKPLPAADAIRKARSDRELFDLLLPYAKEDEEIETALQKLEANLYRGEKNAVDRELLAEIVEEVEERRQGAQQR